MSYRNETKKTSTIKDESIDLYPDHYEKNYEQNVDEDTGIVETKKGVYRITNPIKYREYLLSYDANKKKCHDKKCE